MKRLLSATLGFSTLALGMANAGTIFSDDFSTWNPSLPTASYETFNKDQVVNGWTVTGKSVDLVHTPWAGTPSSAPYWLDLAGTPGPGGVDRSMSFVSGQTYQLSFDAFSNNGFSDLAGNAIYATLGTSTLGVKSSTLNGSNYTHETLNWTASSNQSGLSFYTPDTSNGNVGISHVSVQAVPEPCSMLGLGGAALAFFRRRRNSR